MEGSINLKDIAEAIKKRIPEVKVILFGSRARGDNLKDSDVDLIVVSKIFKEMHFTNRSSYVLKILWEEGVIPLGVNIDILCYTPEELEKKRKEIGVVREALQHGIEL